MARTLQDIYDERAGSRTLQGLISVLQDKLQLQARYALLEYEANVEGRSTCSDLYRTLSRVESDQIEYLGSALMTELKQAGF